MKQIFALFTLLLLAACNLNNPPDNHVPGRLDSIKISRDTATEVRDLKGLYRKDLAQVTDCISNTKYLIEDPKQIDSLYQTILPNAYAGQAIYVEMRTRANSENPHLILFANDIKAEMLNHQNACVYSEYWIFGVQPFWTIQVSEDLNLIDFYDPMTQTSTHFSYVKPKLKSGITYFDADNGKEKISIQLKNEKCNGAIDTQYDLSASVKINERELQGCGTAYAKAQTVGQQ